MDRWLWAARFFKTRALAAKACELGRIEAGQNGVAAKAARAVRVGESLRVRTEGGEFAVEVLGVSEVRGPAAVAQGLYRETEESKAARAKAADERTAGMLAVVLRTPGRPTKRDRRLIHRFTDTRR